MRREVDRIDEQLRTGGMSQFGNLPDRIDGSDQIRRGANGDEPRALTERGAQRIEVERAVVGPNLDVPDDRARVARRELPGRHVRVVIEARDDDLIARLPGPRERSA